jgi:hypothetical protein
MANSTPAHHTVSSSASTGGAGSCFEQHVDATLLSLLLVRGIPPVLVDCQIDEVCFQTKHLGWKTDDFLAVATSRSGNSRKLAGQVKRSFSVSYRDEDCKKAIQNCWQDYRNPSVFDPNTDCLTIVTLRGSNVLLSHFVGLLDCARDSCDASDFTHRLQTPGFLHATILRYCNEIRKIIEDHRGRSIADDGLWPFLKTLYLLSLDLDSSTRQTEAWVKTLLAHTAAEQDPRGAAEQSWNDLLAEVSHGMPHARCYTRDTLPESVRNRHLQVGTEDQRALRAAEDHSAFTLRTIRAVIGDGIALPRSKLTNDILGELETNRVVLISGPAGSGKSVAACNAVTALSAAHFVFAFRAEEFASPHLDEALHKSQIPASAVRLAAVLAGQPRKVLLVESVERLLEASVRAAFADLLTLLREDESWRMILTCRDYSADLVRSSFLEPAGIRHSVVVMPPLDDAELDDVAAQCTALRRPLSNSALRRLLRNPYLLDKASRMPWPESQPLPENERSFRTQFWQDMVRADDRRGEGMPRRRDEAFVEIALRRARALTPYAPTDNLDHSAIEQLHHDSLVVFAAGSDVLAAPAHDVLEDWAILHWLENRAVVHNYSLSELAQEVGTYPAIRRSYRKWLDELVQRSPEIADRMVDSVVAASPLTPQLRDDTRVSLLRSSLAASFLGRHRAKLFADNKELLRRVIRLLRVGCVSVPNWLAPASEFASVMYVPEGPAWASVLALVSSHLEGFSHEDRLLLLGFVEDWARGVSWHTPYPDGAGDVAAIAHWLLPQFNDYRSEDQCKRTLQVISKIPLADKEGFVAMLRQRAERGTSNRAARELKHLILHDIGVMPACRDLPGEVVRLANEGFRLADDDESGDFYLSDTLSLEPLFGLDSSLYFEFFPASAFQGPFLPLLQYHPRAALEFMVDLMNYCAEWYAHPRYPRRFVEPPFQMTLTFADGHSVEQWCNVRLWNLYRGTSVGPHMLQSALMALEHWLLGVCNSQPDDVEAILLFLLRRSECAAVTAVVASIATAFPHQAGEAALVLLRCRDCILLDRTRMVSEMQATSRLFEMFPTHDASKEIHANERKAADAMPHRQQDLESAAANLQLGPLRPQVHEILDGHRESLPEIADQNDEDRIWRLALHRMEMRQYTVASSPLEVAASDSPSDDDERQRVYLQLNEPDPDVQEMLDRDAPGLDAFNALLRLQTWGMTVFNREQKSSVDPNAWQEHLEQARATETHTDREWGVRPHDVQACVAAVCVRDHWDELDDAQRRWCAEVVCGAIERTCDTRGRMERVQRNPMSGDRPAAWVVSALLGKDLTSELRDRVKVAVAKALTHGVDEVTNYATLGLGTHLWSSDRSFALRCTNALALRACLLSQLWSVEQERPYSERRGLDALEDEVAPVIQQRICDEGDLSDEQYKALDATGWIGGRALSQLLSMFAYAPTESAAVWTYSLAANALVRCWEHRHDRRHRGEPEEDYLPHEVQVQVSDLLPRFVLKVSPDAARQILSPILDAVDSAPREVGMFFRQIVSAEDHMHCAERFWAVWELFADRVCYAVWLDRVDDEYSPDDGMVSAVFLGNWWKETTRHWPSLEGYADRIDALLERLPPSSTVLDDYVRFLYHIGEQSLPGAFVRIAGRLQQGNTVDMLSKGNTVFMLEALLRRHVYGRPLELKSNSNLRDAVLLLLDILVEVGSSAAYRMRDDFVTPIPSAD